MKIFHIVVRSFTESELCELRALGVVPLPLAMGGSALRRAEVAEDDPAWEVLHGWMAARNLPAGECVHNVVTTFSDDDVASADWLKLSSGQQGYPLPEDDYLSNVYAEHCVACGWRGRQVAPFAMKGEVKWGRRSVQQLNWVFDEFFVRPEVWAEVLAPLGIASMPVVSRSGGCLKSVVQVVSCRDDVDVSLPLSAWCAARVVARNSAITSEAPFLE